MQAAEIIDGKAFALSLREKITAKVPEFIAATGRKPGLAVILVGDDPASQVYVGSKGKATIAAGMNSYEHRLPADVAQDALVALIKTLNADENVDGILVQLPLPKTLIEQDVISHIDPDKDVDGLHIINAGRLVSGQKAMVPCTPLGCQILLKDYLGDLSGLNAVVLGRSILVGKPMAQLLLNENCTVTMAHSRSKNLADIVRSADIVVAAVGRPEMVKGDWLKDGAVVIDVGINRLSPTDNAPKGKLVGDVDTDAAKPHVKAITPVPGGVGPMTIACLLRNTLVAAYRRSDMDDPKGF